MQRKIPPLLVGGAIMTAIAGCAAGSGEYVGSRAPPAVTNRDARVEAALPGVLEFPTASEDDLWRVLPGAFQTLGIPAGVLDAPNRVYGNYRITESRIDGKPLRDLFRCGSGSGLSRTQYRIQFDITAQPLPLRDGGSELRLQIAATGRAVTASASSTTQCVSNGRLELRFQEVLEAALRGTGF